MALGTYWFIIGTFYLIMLTYQDYKNNMRVDDRRNYFMMGLSVSLISHYWSSIWYKLVLVGVLILLYKFMVKIKVLGQADINTLSWLFLGLGIMDVIVLSVFFAIFGVLTLTFHLLKTYVFRYKQPVPFYGVILLSFVSTSILFGLYLI